MSANLSKSSALSDYAPTGNKGLLRPDGLTAVKWHYRKCAGVRRSLRWRSKLARMIYRMMKFGTEYVEKGMTAYESTYQQQRIKWLIKQAASLNMQLIPSSEVTS